MKIFGLSPDEIKRLKEIFQSHLGDLDDVRVYVFGSRAKGNSKKFSDVDIAIKTKSPDLPQRIALIQEDWEQSMIPYKGDITSWRDIYKEYLPEIRKTKKEIWKPDDRVLHPWRACPYGQHWVVRHDRLPIGRTIQDVDGHCRTNPSKKDRLDAQEIRHISLRPDFQSSSPSPKKYSGTEKIDNPDRFDSYISGWCRYWNEVLKPDQPISPDFVKALMESESRFRPTAEASNKGKVGNARGLIQLTEETLRILKDRKGEIKDHYIDLKKEELFLPEVNICAAIRWLFRKKEILQKRLGRSPQWIETIAEYKGLGPDLKKGGKKSQKVMDDFFKIYKRYQ